MGLVLLFWFEGMRVREFMIKTCKRICREQDLQLLDQTVSLNKIRLEPSGDNWLSIHREYRFEVSTNGTDRLMGYVILDGRLITAVQIDYPEGATIIHPAGPKLLH